MVLHAASWLQNIDGLRYLVRGNRQRRSMASRGWERNGPSKPLHAKGQSDTRKNFFLSIVLSWRCLRFGIDCHHLSTCTCSSTCTYSSIRRMLVLTSSYTDANSFFIARGKLEDEDDRQERRSWNRGLDRTCFQQVGMESSDAYRCPNHSSDGEKDTIDPSLQENI